jgi:hypothetical protein
MRKRKKICRKKAATSGPAHAQSQGTTSNSASLIRGQRAISDQRHLREIPQGHHAGFLRAGVSKEDPRTIEQSQNGLDEWIGHYKNERTRQGDSVKAEHRC